LGCGPEQSAYDRDQQQIQNQYNALKSQLTPYVGKYKGTVTPTQGGDTLNVLLNLNPADIQTTNPSTLTNTKTPSLNGTLILCLSKDCGTGGETTIKIPSASYNPTNGTLSLQTTQNITNCSGASVMFCSNYTIDLLWTSGSYNALVGNMGNSDVNQAVLNLIKQ